VLWLPVRPTLAPHPEGRARFWPRYLLSPRVFAGIYEAVRSRQLPAMHIGSRIRIGRRGLVAFVRGLNADEFDHLISQRVAEKRG
jgi:hypothetical protein